MAEDTRKSDRSETEPIEQHKEQQQQQEFASQPKKPKHEFPKSQAGKLWDAFGSPEEPANTLPDAKYTNSTELKRRRDASASTLEVMKSGNGLSDLKSVHRTPCGRDSLMLGIGAGFGLGGIRGILGGFRAIWPACHWAVYTFSATALISFELCRRRKQKELDGMKQAVEMMQQIRLKKQREKEQKTVVAEEASRVEEERQKSWSNPSNYKFW